jgi:hypothetical protein
LLLRCPCAPVQLTLTSALKKYDKKEEAPADRGIVGA